MLERIQRAHHDVLVEAVAPVGAAEIGEVHAVDLALARLRRHSRCGVQRMVIGDALDDALPGSIFARCD